jgi:hypothetical protein
MPPPSTTFVVVGAHSETVRYFVRKPAVAASIAAAVDTAGIAEAASRERAGPCSWVEDVADIVEAAAGS